MLSGYFWVDQYDGTNVVLLGSATEGTNRMETRDANGYQMVKEIIRVGQEPDGGYVDYVFPKEGETESSPKRSYSKAFEPFQWVIGTGNYTDYIDDRITTVSDEFSGYVTGRLTMFIVSTVIEGAVVIAFLVFIIINIVQPLKKCVASIGVMEQGDFHTLSAQQVTDIAKGHMDAYTQKFMAGGFENVGWCKPGTECFYNVSMMEELQTILSLGAGGVSKRVVRETGWIERANNPKYPLEYIQAADRLANGKKKLLFPKK